MWQESHMDRETRESKVARLEHHLGRRPCGSSGMWTCQKMAQWGPIAEDDDLAGRKCEKGASPSTDKLESLSHNAATTCAFVMMRPIANTRLLLSQRISGCNRAPLWHFLTPGRRNSAIGMRSNQRQSSQRTSDAQMPLRRGNVCQISKMRLGEPCTPGNQNEAKARPYMSGVQKQASRGDDVKKCRHRKCATRRQSGTHRCTAMYESPRNQMRLRRRDRVYTTVNAI